MKLLHLDSSILGDNSVSRQLSAQIVAKLNAANPLPHITLAEFATAESKQLLAEFKEADVVVIGTPMYNFGIPSQLKAWVDRVAVAGETFKYTETGPVGLMGSKRVIIAASNGGYYHAQNAAGASMNHQTAYLKSVLAFMGILNPEIIVAEGTMVGPDAKAAGIAAAEAGITQLAA